jgi:PAS domain S-box-containing protein
VTNFPAKRANAWRAWTPYFVLATTLLFTFVAMNYVAAQSEARDELRFENSVRHIHESIQNRIGTYVTMLRAGASLFAASENVTREEFRIYVERLELQRGNAGIRGIGYSARISPQEKDALVSSMRAGGVKDFKIWPEGTRPEYHSIIYLEPLDERNLRAVGYDMSIEPVRRAAMEQARDSGEPTASGRVTLIQELEDPKQAGFLIYIPVYRDGQIPASEAERREKLMGFIYAPFRVGDLLNGIFGSEKSHEVGFELFDGTALNPGSLLYNSEQAQQNNSYRPRFTARTPMPVAGRTWTLAFATQPQFDEQSGRNLLPYILLVGGLVSLVLFGIMRREVKARTIAEHAANELRRSEVLLRESESRLRRLADANIIGITIGDIHGHVLEANDAFLDLIGYARGELESGKVDWMELTPQEYRHLDQSAMKEMQQTGKHAPFEKEFVRKDGTCVCVLVGTAYLGGANELTVGFILDLTRRKSAEKVLLETEQRAVKEYERLLVRITALAQTLGTARDLQAIFHALRDFAIASVPSVGIFLALYDPEREVRIAAYGWGEGAEVDVSQLPPMPISKDGPNSRAVRTGQVVITDDYMALMRGHPTVTVGVDNGLMPQSSLVAPMAVMGRIVGTIEVQSHELAAYSEEHVTAMQMAANLAAVAIENVQLFERESLARAAAEEASRMKDEFLATVSHELRTPLTSMLGWTYMLRSGELDETTRLRAIETIERNVRLQAQIVDDILDVSRIITGKLRMEVQPVELTALIETAINAVRPAALAKEIKIETRLEAGTHPVSGDANRLQQVFWNVFSNAVKFTPREGSVKIHMQRIGSHVEIRVTDTGLGIRKEFLPYVFDRFRQADSSTTRTYGGLGLGLAIVRHLVEMHGGTVQAESPGEGLGATFILTLPLASARAANEAGEIEQAATGERVSASLEGLHVLIVDDEPDTCEMLKTMLEGNAAKVTTAMSAREALAAIESRGPDILISDIAMPNEDGYDLIRKLRLKETEQGTHLPAIALTAYAREEDRARSLAQGYQAFLTKPVEPSELVSLVAHVAAEGEKSNGRAEQ